MVGRVGGSQMYTHHGFGAAPMEHLSKDQEDPVNKKCSHTVQWEAGWIQSLKAVMLRLLP